MFLGHKKTNVGICTSIIDYVYWQRLYLKKDTLALALAHKCVFVCSIMFLFFTLPKPLFFNVLCSDFPIMDYLVFFFATSKKGENPCLEPITKNQTAFFFSGGEVKCLNLSNRLINLCGGNFQSWNSWRDFTPGRMFYQKYDTKLRSYRADVNRV